MLHDLRVAGSERRVKLRAPPLVGLDGEYHVGIGGADDLQQPVGISVCLQHVRGEQSDTGRPGSPRFRLPDLARSARQIAPHPAHLPAER
jgi:hypothetical protein